MTNSDEEAYITVEEVAAILRVGVRQAARYGERIHTKKAGKRVLFNKAQVIVLAEELGAFNKVALPVPAEMVPIGDMLQTFERQQDRIQQLALEVGRLQGILESTQHQLVDADSVKHRLQDLEVERAALKTQVEALEWQLSRAGRPWWKRFLD